MNEDKHKIKLSHKGESKTGERSNYIKPSGTFWKRQFNKKVRQGLRHKRGNWWKWS